MNLALVGAMKGTWLRNSTPITPKETAASCCTWPSPLRINHEHMVMNELSGSSSTCGSWLCVTLLSPAVCDYLRHIVVLNDRLLRVPNEQLLMNESQQETQVQLWRKFVVLSQLSRSTGFPFPRGFTRSRRRRRCNVAFLGHPQTAIWHHDTWLGHHVELQELHTSLIPCLKKICPTFGLLTHLKWFWYFFWQKWYR